MQYCPLLLIVFFLFLAVVLRAPSTTISSFPVSPSVLRKKERKEEGEWGGYIKCRFHENLLQSPQQNRLSYKEQNVLIHLVNKFLFAPIMCHVHCWALERKVVNISERYRHSHCSLGMD